MHYFVFIMTSAGEKKKVLIFKMFVWVRESEPYFLQHGLLL